MGTRHLICIYQDKEFKVAQYGQWDGYPSGQGADIVKFLKERYEPETFASHAAKTRELTDLEVKGVDATPNWDKVYPHLSRDCGAEILDYVQNNPEPTVIRQVEFAADSLFCEWAYVLNLDTNELEVYQGFNHNGISGRNIFSFLADKAKGEYGIVTFKTSWPISEVTLEKMLELEKDKEDLAP